MREILFRGKRISNDNWVIGGIMKTFHPNYDVKSEFDFFTRKENCYCICAGGRDYFVEQNTIGQYTGLKDKNGKMIFEGDIVRCWDSHSSFEAVVEFGNPNCQYNWGWQLDIIKGDKDANFSIFAILLWVEMEETGAYCEIIGNIHDNPELMEMEKKE